MTARASGSAAPAAAVRVRDLTVIRQGGTLVSSVGFDLGPHDRLLVTADRGDALSGLAYALGGLLPSPWSAAVRASEWSRDWAQFEPRILAARMSSADFLMPRRTILIPEDLDTWFTAGTGRDELDFFGWREGRDPDLDRVIFQLFDRRLMARPIYSLSGGEKQRLAIAEALVIAPDCLILLNALGWLDREHRPVAVEAILTLGSPVIFCDDHVELLEAACTARVHIGPDGVATAPPGLPMPVSVPPGGSAGPRNTAADTLIRAAALSFVHPGFEDVRVIDNASFSVPAARDIFLVGANGTGKSTLANLVCGLEKRYVGDLQVHDTRIGWAAPRQLRARLGPAAPQILFQFVDDNLIRPTVGDYLRLAVEERQVGDRGDVLAWLARLGVALDSLSTELDTVQKKSVVLARMAITRCALGFFDEPAWGLTRRERRHLQEFLERFLADMTRIWITHEPESVPYEPQAIMSIAGGKVEVRNLAI